MEYNQILQGDSSVLLQEFADNAFDTAILDPPYGCNMDTWDKTKVDIPFAKLQQHIKTGKPVLREDSNSRNHRYVCRYKIHDGKELTNFTDVWSFMPESLKTFNKGGKFHLTMKPLLLIMRLIDLLTEQDGRVLDPFSGSGVTALACQRLQRRFICIEKDLKYYEQSVERLHSDVWQPDFAFD